MGGKERYQRLKKLGICVRCGKEKAFMNGVLCESCREKERVYNKENYEWLKAKGICVQCHKEKAWYNSVLCPDCVEKNCLYKIKYYAEHKEKIKKRAVSNSQKRYYKRKEQGVCVRCGKYKAYKAMCYVHIARPR